MLRVEVRTMETTNNIPPLLVSVAVAATLLGVSRRTVQNLLFSSKKLPFKKIGRRTLIPYRSVVELARRDTPTGANGDAR